MQDKENIKNIFDMFNGQHSKQLIEGLYLKNEKNFERTLELFLSGNIPKDEYQVVVVPDAPLTMIDTMPPPAAHLPQFTAAKSDLV